MLLWSNDKFKFLNLMAFVEPPNAERRNSNDLNCGLFVLLLSNVHPNEGLTDILGAGLSAYCGTLFQKAK